MSGFYPHGKPAWYAYTEHFVEDFGGQTGYLAGANTKYPGLNSDKGRSVIVKALWNLQNLIQGARAAELAFINDTGININDTNNAKDIFHTINLIFNSKQTFERGMKYMQSLANAKPGEQDKMYRDVSRYFAYYLDVTIKREMDKLIGSGKQVATMTPKQVESLINRIISNALIESYKKVKDFTGPNGEIRGKFGKYARADKKQQEQEVQAITDMIDIIKQLKSKGAFSQFGYLFDLDASTLNQKYAQAQLSLKQNSYHDAKVDSNYGGNALELITSMVATEIGKINIHNSGLTIVGRHTGQSNQMKADTLLFVGRGTINPDDYLQYVDRDTFGNRVRMQNVDALNKYLNNLENNIEHVIAISDKNYSITASFDGINAQEKMSLQNAGLLLSQFGVDQVPELITYLANCGTNMVQGKVADSVRTELQSYIGYFLFDNLHFEINGGTPKVNVVNLLNVSGLYIPLSVYLEGLYNSIQDAASNPSSLVSVSISLGGPTEQATWTAATWGEFREEHETESFISYKILKGIADFITNL